MTFTYFKSCAICKYVAHCSDTEVLHIHTSYCFCTSQLITMSIGLPIQYIICMFVILNMFPIVPPTISPEVLDQIQDEGITASFTCQATGEPVPIISWYFRGDLLVIGGFIISVNTTTINSRLIISNAESSVVGTYTCNATNVISSDTSFGVLTINGEI